MTHLNMTAIRFTNPPHVFIRVITTTAIVAVVMLLFMTLATARSQTVSPLVQLAETFYAPTDLRRTRNSHQRLLLLGLGALTTLSLIAC